MKDKYDLAAKRLLEESERTRDFHRDFCWSLEWFAEWAHSALMARALGREIDYEGSDRNLSIAAANFLGKALKYVVFQTILPMRRKDPELVAKLREHANEGTADVDHCWRGLGKKGESVADLFWANFKKYAFDGSLIGTGFDDADV